jgi:hypothetical protein
MFAMQTHRLFSSILLFISLSLLSQAHAGFSAIINNSTTVAPFTNGTTSVTATTPQISTTPTSFTVFLTTEIATGPGGPSTITTYITAPVGVAGTQTSPAVGGTAATTSPGLQAGAASLGKTFEGAAVAAAVVAGWMVIWA